MEVAELLKTALDAVDAAGVPHELRPVAFAKAVDLLGGALPAPSSSLKETARESTGPKDPKGGSSGGGSAPTDGLERIATFFGVAEDQIEDYFVEVDGGLRCTFNVDALGKSNAERVRAMATIYVVARKEGGYDVEATTVKTIRDEAKHHGIFDTNNFASDLGGIKSVFVVTGTGQARTYRVKPTSRTEAKKVFGELVRPA